MDPITLLAGVTAAFNGVKKAVEIGREVQDVFSQVGEWAGKADELKTCIDSIKQYNKKPSIFKKLVFDKSETSEAFDIYAAEQKLIEMEKEIFHMFIYGDLQELGIDGYRRLKQIRQEVRDRRSNLIKQQIESQKQFIENIKVTSIVAIAAIFSITIVWFTVELVLEAANK